jgi:hypothetical protein
LFACLTNEPLTRLAGADGGFDDDLFGAGDPFGDGGGLGGPSRGGGKRGATRLGQERGAEQAWSQPVYCRSA